MVKRLNAFERLLDTTVRNMGSSVGKIASFLTTRRIRGVVEDSEYCAIAVYLRKELGESDVEVGDTITVNGVSITTPKAAYAFEAAFDEGKYPDLIQRSK